jgi:thioredoxin 2
MAPEFETVAKVLEPRLRLVKVSTEEAPALATELHISSIPRLALFAGGREVARCAGAMPARQITTWASQAMLDA